MWPAAFFQLCCSLKSVKDAAPWLATCVSEIERQIEGERGVGGRKEGEGPAGQLIRRR